MDSPSDEWNQKVLLREWGSANQKQGPTKPSNMD